MENEMESFTKVSDIMTKDPYSVNIDDTVHKADEIMKTENIRHLPVTEGKKFVGLITERKLAEYNLKKLYEFDNPDGENGYNKIIDFEKIMKRGCHVVYPEDSVQKVIQLMAKFRFDSIPVVDWDNNLVGMVSFLDILLYLNEKIEKGVLV
jgi:CBS domain-containing protein